MNQYAKFATIDSESRLFVSASLHRVAWLDGTTEVTCIADGVRLGVARIWPIALWAENEGLSEKEAEQHANEHEIGPFEAGTSLSGTFVLTANRRKDSKKTMYEIELPDMVVFALFRQGDGPLAVIRGSRKGNSGKVLLAPFTSFFELWGQTAF